MATKRGTGEKGLYLKHKNSQGANLHIMYQSTHQCEVILPTPSANVFVLQCARFSLAIISNQYFFVFNHIGNAEKKINRVKISRGKEPKTNMKTYKQKNKQRIARRVLLVCFILPFYFLRARTGNKVPCQAQHSTFSNQRKMKIDRWNSDFKGSFFFTQLSQRQH